MIGTCPKCGGTGTIRAFRHVVGGTCFMCGGTGRVEASDTAAASTPYRYPGKTAQTKIGPVFVTRHGAGFTGWHSRGQIWFNVRGGRVVNVTISNGFNSAGITARAARAALQGALRG